MVVAHKTEPAQSKVISFAKQKRVPIEPELKSFLDDCVIPMLIREALNELSEEDLDNERQTIADCGLHHNRKEGLR